MNTSPCLKLLLALALLSGGAAYAQDESPDKQPPAEPLAEAQFEAAMKQGADAPPAPAPDSADKSMNLLHMASPEVGGIFMYPIYACSFVVVLFGIERAFGLRRNKVIPRKLAAGLDEMLAGQGTFDPRKAYRLCQQYPSTAAKVLRAVLLKTGRPPADLENAVVKASEQEAERLYANIRPLNLAATIGPLLGLIGTVQGMIIAFFRTAYLPDGANKAQALAEGVYIALVTTFAGLCVAIPAVCLAHFFEGKIQRLFRRIDELAAGLLSVLERYEGKLKASRGPTAHADGEHKEAELPQKAAAPD